LLKPLVSASKNTKRCGVFCSIEQRNNIAWLISFLTPSLYIKWCWSMWRRVHVCCRVCLIGTREITQQLWWCVDHIVISTAWLVYFLCVIVHMIHMSASENGEKGCCVTASNSVMYGYQWESDLSNGFVRMNGMGFLKPGLYYSDYTWWQKWKFDWIYLWTWGWTYEKNVMRENFQSFTVLALISFSSWLHQSICCW